VAAFGVAVGIVLTGGVAPPTVEHAQTAATVDTASIEAVVTGASAAAPAAAATSALSVSIAEALPTPVAAPAHAELPQMKHLWQSLNNCGPAAVVMALSTLGIDASQETARLALRGPDARRGMGPQGVGPWVRDSFGLRSTWRNGGTLDTIKTLVANGFAPMVTQWMEDPSVSRIAHWRIVRGYDDTAGMVYVNDSMLGNNVRLGYEWFGRSWQPFGYRYMVVYRPEDERLVKAILGSQVSDFVMRRDLYERAKSEALAQDTNFAWLAYGEAAYGYGMFEEAVAAFEKGLASGSASGVFGLRSSYPQALRALGRHPEAEHAAQRLSSVTPVPASTVLALPDPYALYLALVRANPSERILEE
jgi:hypothetical protein